MKILIAGFAKIKYMPYLNFYLDNIDRKEHDVHILYWNRDLNDEDLTKYSDCTLHEFKLYQEDDISKLSKVKSFIKYKKHAKSIINKENFDFIFILHSLPGVLLSNVLKRKYINKYIFDYRDSTYENFSIYKAVIGKLTSNSYSTFVSSDAFRRFLPKECKEKIFTSHNLLVDSLDHRNEKKDLGVSSDKIRIAYWGFIRDEKINKEIIKKISNDNRFELHYYGREQEIALNLKAFAKEINADNVYFHGEYKPEDRYEFVRKTDIIHNVFDDDNMMLAMGNKFYDGIIFRIPQLCMDKSFMASKLITESLGLSCSPYDDNFCQEVYEYYVTLNKQDFDNSCDSALSKILKEYYNGVDVIKAALNS